MHSIFVINVVVTSLSIEIRFVIMKIVLKYLKSCGINVKKRKFDVTVVSEYSDGLLL